MNVRTITAASIGEALDKVARELGPDALVIETRGGPGRAEIVAAAADGGRAEPAAGPASELALVRQELALLRREIAAQRGGSAPVPGAPAAAPRLAAVAQRLAEQGLAATLTQRALTILAGAPAGEGERLDPARSEYCLLALAGLLPGIAPSGAASPRGFAFVGPPGAGKTTTIAKLVEQQGGSGGLGVLSLDAGRPGGGEFLRSVCARHDVPFAVAAGPAAFAEALRPLATAKTLLVDTAGQGLREENALSRLRELLAPRGLGVQLVLPVTTEPLALHRAARAHLPLRPASLVFTRLDEAARLGELFNLPCATDLPVAALGHGPRLVGDLTPATRRLLAAVLLGRRRLGLEPAA